MVCSEVQRCFTLVQRLVETFGYARRYSRHSVRMKGDERGGNGEKAKSGRKRERGGRERERKQRVSETEDDLVERRHTRTFLALTPAPAASRSSAT